MFILITVSILLLTALILLVLRFFAPTFRYNWPIAVGGALFGWISVFAWQGQMPITLQFSTWQPATLFSQSPNFIADGISWVFAISLATLCFSILITAAVRSDLDRKSTRLNSSHL